MADNTEKTYDTSDIRNLDFRNAFNTLSRAAQPFFREDAYHSDLLWDARTLAQMDVGAVVFLLVRGYGTLTFVPLSNRPIHVADKLSEAIDHCDPRLCDGRAVLRVARASESDWNISVSFEHREPAQGAA